VASVVLELQRDALNQGVRVSDLLRKSLVVARKLGLSEFQQWIEEELSGYKDAREIPDYREVSGQIRAWNPYNGWIPVLFQDPREGERLSKRKSGQSIAEIENLLEGKSTDSSLHMPFPQEVQRRLCKGMPFETEVTLFTQYSGLVRLVDAVRTIILNWSLKLEEDGILGEGLSFTPEEKHQAGSHSYNITNFFGPVQGPQVQQGSERSVQVSATFDFNVEAVRALLDRFRAHLDALDLNPSTRAEAEAEIATVDAQLRSPRPKPSIVREGLQSLRSILEGAGGGAAAQLLIELGKLLL
jgi:hypothetical protein